MTAPSQGAVSFPGFYGSEAEIQGKKGWKWQKFNPALAVFSLLYVLRVLAAVNRITYTFL